MIKGKQIKRPRPSSSLALSKPSALYSCGEGGGDTASSTTSAEWDQPQADNSREEVEDTANCLILLAQGSPQKSTHQNQKPLVGVNANKAAAPRVYPYECKTCDRRFPSFQALGGHHVSHRKPKPSVNGPGDHFKGSDSALTLQIAVASSTKPKVHECSICGAEFSSGQALGGHMRRHRTLMGAPGFPVLDAGAGSHDRSEEEKKSRNSLDLDLNLPAPEDDGREQPRFVFASNEKTLVFSSASLVDYHF
ncbi:hypothetical protein Nepgr_011699 [Nepenthes gracilis]|uniref:C2H2-type domain-containing protein n=1 Tax=Nepenthes gracilis TaxID=150966 RepID=A0AAD3SEM1_NEPGR|nr:hypothetical protein Nepgr_011699 [Nepenthes gracilis]